MGGGCGNALYFWNPCVERNTGIYIVLGFGKVSEFLNFGIYFLFKNNSRKFLKSYLSHEKSQKLEKNSKKIFGGRYEHDGSKYGVWIS